MSLKQKTITNVKIAGGLEVFSKILGTVTSIVLARLLIPSDFGIIAIVYLFLAAINLFGELGFGAAIIHRKENIEGALNTGFTLNLILSGFLFAVAFFSAPYLAAFYDSPDLTLVTQVMAISLLFSSFGFVPSIRLRKGLKFGKIAIPTIFSSLTNTVVAIFLAFLGFGYWSLVYGALASSIVNLLLLMKVSPWRPKISFDKKVAKELFGYGKYLFAANIIIFINVNVDDAIGGKILGLTALGHYYIAYRWGNFSQRISGMAERVMFPTYATIQNDAKRLKRWYLQVLRYVSIFAFPVSLGLVITAPEFVLVVLGDKWEASIIPMRILCFYGLFLSLSGTTGSVFTAVGKPKLVRNLSFINTVVILVLIYPLTVMFGIIGLSLVVTTAIILSSIASFYYILKVMDIKLVEYLNSIKPAFISTSVAFIVTALLKYVFGMGLYHLHDSIILIISFLVFSAVYLIVFSYLYREFFIEIVSLIKQGAAKN